MLSAAETVYQRALASEDFAAAVRALQLQADVLGLRRAADTSALSPDEEAAIMAFLSERPGSTR